jgi:hypothetical protein
MDTKCWATSLRIALGVVVTAFTLAAWGDDTPSTAAETSSERNLDDVTIEEVLAAWHARQALVQSLHFTIRSTKVMPSLAEEPLPLEQELFIDGMRYRYDSKGPLIHLDRGYQPRSHYLQLYDGTDSIFFQGVDAQEDRVHSFANVETAGHERYFSEAHNGAVSPIFFAYRISQPWFLSDSVDGWRLTGEQGIIDGRVCLIVQYTKRRNPNSQSVYNVWVDPSRNFVIVRKYRIRANGQPFVQLDIEYESDPLVGWVPVHWIDNIYYPGPDGNAQLFDASSYEVTDYEFNQPIDESVFEFTFPVGTEVRDHGETYLVTDDGNRIVTDDERERGARYTDWMVTESGEALLPPQPFPLWRWISIVAVLCAGSWYFMRARRSGRTS